MIFLFIVLQNQLSTASSEATCPGHTGFVDLLFAHLFFCFKYFNWQRDNSVAKPPFRIFKQVYLFSSRVSPLVRPRTSVFYTTFDRVHCP